MPLSKTLLPFSDASPLLLPNKQFTFMKQYKKNHKMNKKEMIRIKQQEYWSNNKINQFISFNSCLQICMQSPRVI
jgi:hypothetical protein